jgi:uncharacterized protein
MYLLDTNIWLERLLDQEKAGIVGEFLNKIAGDQLTISDFSLHSIGVILVRLKQEKLLNMFIDDLFSQGKITMMGVPPEELKKVTRFTGKFHLDFDDGYQYVLCKLYDLQLVSFDKDFDKTDLARKEPSDFLELLNK